MRYSRGAGVGRRRKGRCAVTVLDRLGYAVFVLACAWVALRMVMAGVGLNEDPPSPVLLWFVVAYAFMLAPGQARR